MFLKVIDDVVYACIILPNLPEVDKLRMSTVPSESIEMQKQSITKLNSKSDLFCNCHIHFKYLNFQTIRNLKLEALLHH